MTKRFSAVARVNSSSFQSLHFSSLAEAGEAASAARAMVAMRKNLMAVPGARIIRELRARGGRGSGEARCHAKVSRPKVWLRDDRWHWSAAGPATPRRDQR